ncbi:MAG: GntR family transcriptional regulator [Firmicutes bacterium]|nr:GntR family transcriptional regulator [Bacillota bacterium]
MFDKMREDLYRKLKREIINGEIPSGSRIIEYQIANDLGINKVHVHKVLNELEQEGLVQYIPMKGFVSCGLCKEDLIEYAKIRLSMEDMLYSEFFETGSEKDKAEIIEIAKRAQAMMKAGLRDAAVDETIALYEKLYASVDMPHVLEIIRKSDAYFRTMYRSVYHDPKDMSKAIKNWSRFIKAVETNDLNLMHEWMYQRYTNSVERINASEDFYSRKDLKKS